MWESYCIANSHLPFVQIYDIETRYLTDANPRGNAVRGEVPYILLHRLLSQPKLEQGTHVIRFLS